jgi:hypothetical protein
LRFAQHVLAQQQLHVFKGTSFVLAYEPNARGLLMFFDGLDGFSWRQEVGVPIHNQAQWDLS